MATPVAPKPSKTEQIPQIPEKVPVSPTLSVKSNASSSTVAVETQQYQQFPSQAARIPTSHQPESANSIATNSPNQHATTFSKSRSVEAFSDLHLSGGEPRIFPGIVSRTQRKNSHARKSSWSEAEDGRGRRRKETKGTDGVVVEEGSDREIEEAGGSEMRYGASDG